MGEIYGCAISGWHYCCICKRAAAIQCYCCPKSVCGTDSCIKEAVFVQVKKKAKGFCSHCLKLAILIEENKDVDSDGGKIDFKDTTTYEFLFKDYWEIIKDQEKFTLVDLQTANALLKRGENCQTGSDSDELEEVESDFDEFKDNFNNGLAIFDDLKGMSVRSKKRQKRSRPKKKEFVGWGSVELIGFLASFGKDTKEPLTQLDACEIVKDYIQENKLHDPNDKKKKNVICDERLHTLFRKKKVKFHKIYSLLESHFASSDNSDDELSFSSEEGDDAFGGRKKQKKNNDYQFDTSHLKNQKRDLSALYKSHYASIVSENINLVYMRRSLIVELLKDPDTFEAKVSRCFVRVKLDPKYFYSLAEKMYVLGQVTGVKNVSQTYKIGEMSTAIVLRVSNMHKDVPIYMLSDDDFQEDECEDLCKLANKGVFNRPTVADLEEKVRSIHADIMNHWIDKEILKLQKLIDQANEKGWRRELFQYIDKREKLLMPEERNRLLQEIPDVVVDTCQIEEHRNSPLNSPPEKKDNGSAVHLVTARFPGQGVAIHQTNDEMTLAENQTSKDITQDINSTSSGQVVETKGGEVPNSNSTNQTPVSLLFGMKDKIWHYTDPSGNEQGPFNMVCLKYWMEQGYFGEDFKVWRAIQSREDAMLLTDALGLCQ
ncbi:uncharacterized protein At5g08430-like isoform X2 [Zingiber officinale]|uniref:uncharacterized protein At5g08430-like isoform X2 n=1 Tax=Zingiber officinale TaxID=94328 RepID=UPI001C4BCE23|nr:uncharacterized protein At5g08430-like isoform X2 [Zingiber officinale]